MRRLFRSVWLPLLVALALLAAACGPPPGASGGTPYAAALTRSPYLTDLVGQHVIVSWATDRSGTTGSLQWGAVNGGTCTLTNTQSASRFSLVVGTVNQYRWTASLDLPAAGTYCYRVFLGGTDLLATNPTPRFVTQAPAGDPTPFSFGVMGDWGQVDANGQNPYQALLLSQVAASGIRFMLTVGDNGYPSGSQTNYGDLKQTGANTSAIFGPWFWNVPGNSIPIFTAVGNHGLSGTTHSDITNFPQDVAVSSSGGRYQNDVYCCVNGTSSANYGSEWYAFNAGMARFYVLDAAWGDSNVGSGDVYSNDVAAHWVPGAPEYEWLRNDLATHPASLKFAVFHYPLYSDNKQQSSDVPLQNALEPLLTQYGVDLAFNGHAHIYQRNQRSAPGAPITYVTGGGGGTLEYPGPCSAIDAYAIGWSNSKSKGYACGAATAPTQISQVYHYLKVTVAGTTVTVAPTDSFGNTFDVQTYDFGGAVPDTVIDSAPPAFTPSTSVSITMRATQTPASYQCSLDGAAYSACTSPVAYSGLSDGDHSVAVRATSSGGTDPTPAVASWTVDTDAPSTPQGIDAAAPDAYSATVSWDAASDDNGVTGYEVQRDGTTVGSVDGATLGFTDRTVAAGTAYQYTVMARDAAGNESSPSTAAPVTTPAAPPPVWSDGFESGDLSAWTSTAGLVAQQTTVRSGAWAAKGNTTNGSTYAKRVLPSTYSDGYARTYFEVASASSQVNLLRLRTASGGSLGYVFVTPTGELGLRNDVTATTTMSGTSVDSGWHALELHMAVDGTSSSIDVWLDGIRITTLSPSGVDLGTAPIGEMQIGEVQGGRTYDVTFDDAAFGTSRIGL